LPSFGGHCKKAKTPASSRRFYFELVAGARFSTYKRVSLAV
jgi:hypothetical protein